MTALVAAPGSGLRTIVPRVMAQESKIPAAGLLTDPALKPLSESALYLTIAAAVMITIAMMLFKRTL